MHPLHHKIMTSSDKFKLTSSPETHLHEEFPFDDSLFVLESTNSIPTSYINIVDSILNEIMFDDERFELRMMLCMMTNLL